MVRDIVHSEAFLSIASVDATEEDAGLITDLYDTLQAHSSDCVGMAANMIGVRKRVIAFSLGCIITVMINPVIKKKKGEYRTKEGCLSLSGVRDCIRYHEIDIEYLDTSFKKRKEHYAGFAAEIIQHEMDHLEGIII